jgi:8-oxo-dGTP pyrophosphatase MutT (NUDIX family)
MQNNLISKLRAAVSNTAVASSDFDLNPDYDPPENRILRPAAVLIGITAFDDHPRVVLTQRSSHLKHHPGQIAFPGGKQDQTDQDAVACALREAREEIGLPSEHVDILGTIAPHETVTGFQVTPVVGLITRDFDPTPEEGEVAEVFAPPLSFLAAPSNYAVQQRRWRGQWRKYYTVPFGPYYIWGATARILRGLAEQMAQSEQDGQ